MSVSNDDCAMLLNQYRHHPEERWRRRALEEIERRRCPSICDELAALILQGDTRLVRAIIRGGLETRPALHQQICDQLGRRFVEGGGDSDALRELRCLEFMPGLDQQVFDATLGTTDDARIIAGMHVLFEGRSQRTLDLLRALIAREGTSAVAKGWAIEMLSRVHPAPLWARETVLPFLKDPDPEMRLNACYALGGLGLPEDLSALEALFDDDATCSSPAAVGEMAREAHEAITTRRDHPELYADT